MVLIRWFESKQNWVNIGTIVLAACTFAAANLGMLGLTAPTAFIVSTALILVNNGLTIYLRNTSTALVASKDEVAAQQLGQSK